MKVLKFTIALLLLVSVNVFAQSKAIKVEIKGNGSPVILLPGFTCPGEVWNETVEHLSAKHECHIVSYAGFGDLPAIQSDWFKTIQKDLLKYILSNKLKEITIIGHSMGGTLGLWVASQIDVKHSIIIDALPCMGAVMIPNYKSENMVYDNPYNNKILNMDDNAFKAMATQFTKYICKDTSKHKQINDWILKADRKTYVYGYTDLMKVDLRDEISKISSKVIVLAAANPNRAFVEGNYNKQYANLKNMEIKYVENSAHFIMFDKFDWYINEIKNVLNK